MEPELTAARLRELLHYDPETGIFTWNATSDVAGSVRRDGYVTFRCEGAPYVAHRLAWLYMQGEWPTLNIDHRDGNRANNAFTNLRQATHCHNAQNRVIRSDNSSGFPGVGWHKSKGAWQAKIGINGRRLFLGNFATREDACAAYLRAKELHHEFQPSHRPGAVPALAQEPSLASSA